MPTGLKRVGRSFSYTRLADGPGYMYWRRIDNSIVPGVKEALAAHPNAKGWIVDLRGNGGGGYGRDLIEQINSMPQPVAVLIDAGCVSAGETVARDFVRGADAMLIGTRTGGSSSSKRTWTFPSQIASVIIPTRSRWGVDGKPIEYNGIAPYVEIEALPEEAALGINSAIRQAQDYLAAMVSKDADTAR
jgi:C-terminal processing protease CtpA/Prc